MVPAVDVVRRGSGARRPLARERAAADGPAVPSDAGLPLAEEPGPPARGVLRRVLLVLGAVVLLLAVWLAVRGVQMVQALRGAAPEVAAVQAALADGDVEAASARLPLLQEHAGAALAVTGDPVWRGASHLPWLGAQLRAVGDLVVALDLTASDVVPSLAQVAAVVEPGQLVPVDGAVPLEPLLTAQPAVATATEAAQRAHGLVEAIPTSGLVAPLADAVRDARGPLGEAASLLGRVHEAVTLLPPMLGAAGPRDYLVLVLNPAELRSGGGIVGSVTVLHAEEGRLSLGERLAARTLAQAPQPELTAEELAVHGDRLGSIIQNVTMTPDFPRAAELAVDLWRGAGGGDVDGVLAVEPVALSHLLGVTGPVTATDGTVLDQGSVVRELLHDAYARYPDPDRTDAFFADAAGEVFDAMVTDPGSPEGLGEALGRSVTERRIQLWSAHGDEQEVLAGTPLGGAFFGEDAAEAAGVFLDDGTGTKLDYFLDAQVALACADPVPGQGTRVVVQLDLASRVPAEVSTVPRYMATNGFGEPPTGVKRTNVTFYSPVGGRVVEIRSGDTAVGAVRAAEQGRDVAVLTSTLVPGETVRYEAVVELPDGRTTLGAWRTPSLEGAGTVTPTSCAS